MRFYRQLFSVSLRFAIESYSLSLLYFRGAHDLGCLIKLGRHATLDFLHTGKEKDAEAGHGYFGARYMDH